MILLIKLIKAAIEPVKINRGNSFLKLLFFKRESVFLEKSIYFIIYLWFSKEKQMINIFRKKFFIFKIDFYSFIFSLTIVAL